MAETAKSQHSVIRRLAANTVLQDISFLAIHLYSAVVLTCMDVHMRRSSIYLEIYDYERSNDWSFLNADYVIQYVNAQRLLVDQQLEETREKTQLAGWFYDVMPSWISDTSLSTAAIVLGFNIVAMLAVKTRYRRGRFFIAIWFSVFAGVFCAPTIISMEPQTWIAIFCTWGLFAANTLVVAVHRALGERAWKPESASQSNIHGALLRLMDPQANVEKSAACRTP